MTKQNKAEMFRKAAELLEGAPRYQELLIAEADRVERVSEKPKVFEIIDDRIEAVNRKIEHFDRFGNISNQQELIEHAINISCREALVSLKSDLYYGVP